jgi:hypothetical protein
MSKTWEIVDVQDLGDSGCPIIGGWWMSSNER